MKIKRNIAKHTQFVYFILAFKCKMNEAKSKNNNVAFSGNIQIWFLLIQLISVVRIIQMSLAVAISIGEFPFYEWNECIIKVRPSFNYKWLKKKLPVFCLLRKKKKKICIFPHQMNHHFECKARNWNPYNLKCATTTTTKIWKCFCKTKWIPSRCHSTASDMNELINRDH